MGAAWMVRSRQLAARFRFWLAMFGYDRNDPSLAHKIYLVYAGIFYTLWGFAVLSLLAQGTAHFLEGVQGLIGVASLAETAISLATLGLLGWWLFELARASRSSPFIFTEEDAYLICLTPADRRKVALAWVLGQWPGSAIPIAAVMVTLGFALVEGAATNGFSPSDIPGYLLAGACSLVITIPLQFGLLSLSAALGAYRLRSGYRRRWVAILPLSLAAVIAIGIFVPASLQGGLNQLSSSWVFQPISAPLTAGFGQADFISGFLGSLAWAGVGLVALWAVSSRLNLSRAAQESRSRANLQTALNVGALRDVEDYRLRDRLGTHHQPSAWLQPSGWRERLPALVRKDRLQAERSWGFGRLLTWFGIFALGAGIVLAPSLLGGDAGAEALAIAYWILLIMQQSTRRLQDDLAHWGIFRQLPVRRQDMILQEVAGAWAITTLTAWGSLLAGALLSRALPGPAAIDLSRSLFLVILVPMIAGAVILAGCLDVIRQSKSAFLLASNPPQPGSLGLVLGIVPALIAAVLLSLPEMASGFGFTLALMVCTACVWLYWHLSARQMGRIQ